MWPGFDSRTRCHMWVEFNLCWFSSLLRGFFSRYSGFPPSIKKTNISEFQFDLDVKCLLMSPWLRRLGNYSPHYEVKFDFDYDNRICFNSMKFFPCVLNNLSNNSVWRLLPFTVHLTSPPSWSRNNSYVGMVGR